jgi:hypothetical protein
MFMTIPWQFVTLVRNGHRGALVMVPDLGEGPKNCRAQDCPLTSDATVP